MHSSLFVGIDVSQALLDVALRPGTSQTLSHDEAGIATLVEHLHGLDPTLIILEATGGWTSRWPVHSPWPVGEVLGLGIPPRFSRMFRVCSPHE